MKKLFVLLIVLSMSCVVLPVQAATQAEIDAAIASGLTWLVEQQNPDGSWGTYYYVGHTGFAVLKLETHALQTGWDPLDPSYAYYSNVTAGLNYLFAKAYNISISVQPAGDPDTNGNGWGTCFYHDASHRGYESAIAMMAIAASTHPEMVVNVPGSVVDGRTYFDVMQDAVDYYAYGQEDTGSGRGGWRYYENFGSADNSISGLVTLALAYAEASSVEGATGFSCTVPQFVKDELSIWVDYIQNDASGGSGYEAPTSWVNIYKTGGLLVEMAYLGDTPSTQRVIDAINYLETNWNVPNADPGWRGTPASYLAIFNVVKGLDAFGVQTLGGIDWFDEMADVVITQQLPDGSWPTDGAGWGNPILSTEMCLLFLQRVSPIEPPVGGVILGVDSLAVLAPYIIALIAVGVAATAIIKKRRL
jgi:hypothetical protein